MPYDYKQPGNWKTTRRRILTRDSNACYMCGHPANEVDHITAVAAGGTHTDDNLAAICTPHHEAKSKAERAAGRARAHTARTTRTQEQHPGVIHHM